MSHIVLIGDSIFDNASYVDAGESVPEMLGNLVADEVMVSLLAVDGDVTTDVPQQLNAFPQDATHAFVSCGGNDALRVVAILEKSVATVGDAMGVLSEVRREFRSNYSMMLRAILGKIESLTVCTIYNAVPGIDERALTALALFNEIIIEEAALLKLPIIDLRLVCDEESDYSSISPIEPSAQGSVKIAHVIQKVVESHDFTLKNCTVYV